MKVYTARSRVIFLATITCLAVTTPTTTINLRTLKKTISKHSTALKNTGLVMLAAAAAWKMRSLQQQITMLQGITLAPPGVPPTMPVIPAVTATPSPAPSTAPSGSGSPLLRSKSYEGQAERSTTPDPLTGLNLNGLTPTQAQLPLLSFKADQANTPRRHNSLTKLHINDFHELRDAVIKHHALLEGGCDASNNCYTSVLQTVKAHDETLKAIMEILFGTALPERTLPPTLMPTLEKLKKEGGLIRRLAQPTPLLPTG